MDRHQKKKRNVHGQCENFALVTQLDLYSTCSRWGLALGVTQILALLDTNIRFCVAMEYRLKPFKGLKNVDLRPDTFSALGKHPV